MLSLKRKTGEKILIGDDIVIQIGRFDKEGILIGVEAPKHIRVDREEVRERRDEERRKENAR